MEPWLPYIDLLNKYGWLVLLLLLERRFQTRPLQGLPRGWWSDLIHTFDPWVKPLLIAAAVGYLQPKIPDLPLKGALAQVPLWANFIALALISEISFYFIHRLTHINPVLWEFHRVHHSSTTYYSLMTSRFHPIDALWFETPYLLITIWLGVPFEAMVYYAIFRGFMDRYGHSNVNGPRWHGRIIGTPHFHAWHHSTEPAALNMNFGRDFVFMDFLMGTAYDPPGRIAEEFGEPGYPTNYFVQMYYPFVAIWRRYLAPKPVTSSD